MKQTLFCIISVIQPAEAGDSGGDNKNALSAASRALNNFVNDPGVALRSTPGFTLSPASG